MSRRRARPHGHWEESERDPDSSLDIRRGGPGHGRPRNRPVGGGRRIDRQPDRRARRPVRRHKGSRERRPRLCPRRSRRRSGGGCRASPARRGRRGRAVADCRRHPRRADCARAQGTGPRHGPRRGGHRQCRQDRHQGSAAPRAGRAGRGLRQRCELQQPLGRSAVARAHALRAPRSVRSRSA